MSDPQVNCHSLVINERQDHDSKSLSMFDTSDFGNDEKDMREKWREKNVSLVWQMRKQRE